MLLQIILFICSNTRVSKQVSKSGLICRLFLLLTATITSKSNIQIIQMVARACA